MPQNRLPEQNFAARVADFQAGDTREAAQTADMYSRVAARLFAGSGIDRLERWRKPEFMDDPGPSGEIDEAKIPPGELAAFKKARQQQVESNKQFLATAVNDAIEISKRPTCRFHFDPSVLAPTPPAPRNPNSIRIRPVQNNPYGQLNELIGVVAGEPMTTPDQPARRFLAALKMEKHLRNGQPTTVVIEQLKAEQVILHRIDQWSLDKTRTKQELRDLLGKLSAEFQSPESPVEALLADHVLISNIIDGKVTPYILTTTPIAAHAYLAYLANQLWWEHERARQALDRITRRNIYDVEALTNYLADTTPREIGISRLHHWLRPDYGGLPELWVIQEPLAVTSYLVSLEYTARVPVSALKRAYCDNEVCRRATDLQLALAQYRLDHKKYPPQLADLVPNYLHELPLDPYALQPFQYQPSGLNLPLKYWNPYGDNERIEPHTSLFWTVGPGDVRLKQLHQAEFPDNSEPQPNGEEPVPKKEEPRYEFVNEQAGWWNTKNLAFPLPQ
jgi:hypothetical protein